MGPPESGFCFLIQNPVTTWNRSRIIAVLYRAAPRCTPALPAMASKHRLSVNLSLTGHRELQALAEHTRVSKAWIGRQAIAEFLERYRESALQLPLDLAGKRGTGERQ